MNDKKTTTRVGFKYTDGEILDLVRLNPGYGLERFIKVIYPSRKAMARHRFKLTMLLDEYQTETGEDLYSLIQSQDFDEMVPLNEYLEITGEKHPPKGYGRRAGRKGVKLKDAKILVPLPPQTFNWGDIQIGGDANYRTNEVAQSMTENDINQEVKTSFLELSDDGDDSIQTDLKNLKAQEQKNTRDHIDNKTSGPSKQTEVNNPEEAEIEYVLKIATELGWFTNQGNLTLVELCEAAKIAHLPIPEIQKILKSAGLI